jgi:hypothetical protein
MINGEELYVGQTGLRNVRDEDLPIFFRHQKDEQANTMAAFTAKDPTDRDAFMAHWRRILADSTVIVRTITFNGQLQEVF